MIRAEPTQRDVADRRVDVAIDEPRVAVGGCGADVSSLVRHPRAGQELANGDGAAARWWSGVVLAVESGDDGFGFAAVMADRDPPATLATGQRIESVVGDDIEAGVAFNDVGHPSSSTTSEPTRRSSQRRSALHSPTSFVPAPSRGCVETSASPTRAISDVTSLDETRHRTRDRRSNRAIYRTRVSGHRRAPHRRSGNQRGDSHDRVRSFASDTGLIGLAYVDGDVWGVDRMSARHWAREQPAQIEAYPVRSMTQLLLPNSLCSNSSACRR